MQRILIMAGGTGGHIFPALSVAKELQQRGISVEWLGTPQGMEHRLVPAAGLPIHYIQIGGLRGKGVMTKLLLPLKLLKALWQSFRVFKQVNPDAVLGMGGFASGPGGLMARLLGKPLVVHEQNAVAGMTNSYLAKVATKVLAAFPGAFKSKVESRENFQVVGNPVREEVLSLPSPAERYEMHQDGLNILVVGGSLGAKKLNQLIPETVAEIKQNNPTLIGHVIHQCGEKNLAETEALYEQLGLAKDQQIQVQAFIDDMAQELAKADLVICRSGALTVSEIAAAGVAALFVPYPYAVDDHQTGNANYLAKESAAMIIQEKELSVDTLVTLIKQHDRQQLKAMAVKAREKAFISATQDVANALIDAFASKKKVQA